jgi:lysophospholipase L1-like esterase
MNIRVVLNTNIADGSEVVFRSPADCSQVTGLVIYHNGGKTEFAFADAHGNNVGDIDHLFAENAVVKVILDVTANMAFVQNADTNAYIERTFVKSVNGQAPDDKGNVSIETNAPTEEQIADAVNDYLTEHPEATTTVQNKSITDEKLSDSVLARIDGNAVFKGKTASFYGDSLTAFNSHYTKGYHSWVKDILGLASYSNYGVSGYKISDVYTKVDSINDTADIIFIMCGVNDLTFSVPLGAMGDNTTGTTYGALNLFCSLLKQKYPTRLVVFITPHYVKRLHSGGFTSFEVSKAIREVCEKYAIPVYDNFALSGIYQTNFAHWTTDQVHWNDKAHEMVGKNLARFMTQNFAYICTDAVEPEEPEEPEKELESITVVFDQDDAAIYTTDTLDTLKQYLTVTASFSDNTSETVTGYTLSGALNDGNNTITVSYGGKSTTFVVVVTAVSVVEPTRVYAKDYGYTDGKFISNGGSIASFATYAYSEAIPIGGTKATINSDLGAKGAFYDANETFISLANNGNTSEGNFTAVEFDIPINAKYWKFNINKACLEQYYIEYR